VIRVYSVPASFPGFVSRLRFRLRFGFVSGAPFVFQVNAATTQLPSFALQVAILESALGVASSNATLQQNSQKDLNALKTCASGSAGTAGAGAGLLAAGSNVLSTGTKIGNFTPGTSVASQFFRAVLPQTIEATWGPTLLNPLATSSVLGGVVGRWVPVVPAP
jgi:hypothetical protein